MSRTRKHNDKYQNGEEPKLGRGRQRRLSVRGVRRDDPDLRRMGKALVVFALAEAEAAAEQRRSRPSTTAPDVAEAADEDITQ